MSAQYQRRVKIVEGVWLHVSSESLSPTFEIPRTAIAKLNRRGLIDDEISIEDLQDILNHLIKERAFLTEEFLRRQEKLRLLSNRAKWRRPILTLLLQHRARTRLDQAIAQEQAEIGESYSQIEACGMRLKWSMSSGVSHKYETVLQTFTDAALCEMIWNVTDSSVVDQFTERSNASRAISRYSIRLEKGQPQGVLNDDDGSAAVPSLRNGRNERLYLFPGIAVLEGVDGSNIWSMKDLVITPGVTRFVEDEILPRDTTIVGYSWSRENKDGSPDRRFGDNRQIPNVRYGQLQLNGWGLSAEYLFSSDGYGRAFGRSLEALKASIIWESQNRSLTILDQ
mgnify:CR=1 FL=1